MTNKTKRPTPPCKDCPDRAPGCHGQCEKYQSYKRADEDFKAGLIRDKGMDYFAARARKAVKILQRKGEL